MGAKVWLLIVVLGIASICAFGFMAKFMVESNPRLLKLGNMKQALAEDFSSQGLEEVSVRALPGRRGYEVRLSVPRSQVADVASFARTAAWSCTQRYGAEAPAQFKVTLVEPAGFGCSGPKPYFEKEFSTAQIRDDVAYRDTLARLEASLPRDKVLRVLEEAGVGLRTIVLEAPRAVTREAAAELGALARPKVLEHVVTPAQPRVVVRVRAEGSSAALWEETLERAASRQRPHRR